MAKDGDYVWRRLSGGTAFENPYYRITRDQVRHPRGQELEYWVIRPHRAAAGIVPVADDGRILLVQQYRYATEKLSWEIPAGGMNEGETPMACAGRELREETGYAAGEIEPLYAYHPSQGSSSQTFNLFVGRRLSRVGEFDGQEIHALRFVERGEIEGMLQRNEIVDGLSLTALLLYLRKS